MTPPQFEPARSSGGTTPSEDEFAEEATRAALGSSPIRRLANHSGVRYLVAGGVCFLIDFGLLALFSQVLHWPLWLATGAAFLISFFFTYGIQRVFSFSSRAPHGAALVKYAILVGFNTLATIAIVALITNAGAGWAIGKIGATVVTTVWNYFIYRYWVFAHPRRKHDASA